MAHYRSIDYVPEDSLLVFIRQTQKETGFRDGETRISAKAMYRCVCGNEKEMRINHVKSGTARSCGCLNKKVVSIRRTTHGLSDHTLHSVWSNIIARCENENNNSFMNYGGSGVQMCQEWRNDFKKFYDWAILNGWKPGMEIDKDKIPRRLGIPAILYSPDMCSVLTSKQNNNNRSDNVLLVLNGKSKTISEWAEEIGLKATTIYSRIKRMGWSHERALTEILNR